MNLRFFEIARQEYGVRSTRDRRVVVDREVCAYKDEQGNEYRKAFEFKRGTAPIVPPYGTHDELNDLKYQW